MTDVDFENIIDKNQKALSTHFPAGHFLSYPENTKRVLEWTTFFRRNLHRFAMDYLGIKLYPYQQLMLYEMGISQLVVVIASRAAAKSFIIALYACCRCILYPRSKIVLASATRGQSTLIVSEKIEKELYRMSPTLRREIEKITSNKTEVEVVFRNGSSIIVVTANENARGHRSTGLVNEEFRQMNKDVVDSVLTPFLVIRDTGYIHNEEYANNPALKEEPVSIYISSSWIDNGHWMWDIVDTAKDGMMKGNGSCLLAFDESVTLRHNIRTRKQMFDARKILDPLSWRIEYLNERVKQNQSAFFPYDLFEKNQKLRQPWYPTKTVDFLTRKKNPYGIPKQINEVRVVACDMAFVTNEANDNSVFTCGRLLPEKDQDGIVNYKIAIPYIESMQGGEIKKQATRIRQLFEDFEADYLVLDTRNAGISVLDMLARVMYDDERRVEYSPIVCMNNDELRNRGSAEGAVPCVYAVNASLKLNSDIAMNFRMMLNERKIDLLIPFTTASEEILPQMKEYNESPSADEQTFYERPFLETQALVSESCALVYEKKEQTGAIMIHEQGNNRKDRYSSASYLAYFAGELSRDMLGHSEDYEFTTLIN